MVELDEGLLNFASFNDAVARDVFDITYDERFFDELSLDVIAEDSFSSEDSE